MYKHWKEVLQAKIELGSKSEILQDIVIDSRAWKPVYALTASKRLIPLSVLKSRENILECMAGALDVESLPIIESLSELTAAFELKISNKLNVRVQRDLEDEESPHLDYTSALQPLSASAKTNHFWKSARELLGFQVQSSTGVLGPIVDLVFELPKWNLRYFLAADDRVKSREILIDPEWIEATEGKSLTVNLSREALVLEAVFDTRRVGNKRYQIDV